MTTKKNFSLAFFSVFFSLLFGLITFTWKRRNDKRTELLPLSFSEAITRIKFLRGSSISAFVDLSNGHQYLFTFPVREIEVGDSVIKIKNQPYFIIKKATGTEVGKVTLNGDLLE